MNKNEKYIARIMYQLKVHQADGQKYEDLFIKVMSKANCNFQAVKAYGRIGDMKNDGFDKTRGVYYQVFGPEDISKQSTIKDAVEKLRGDFEGLKKHWHDLCPIKEFYYVVNDKYKGVPAPIHQEIIALNNENKDIKCDIFASKNLEDVFLRLDDEDIIDTIGFIPDEDVDILDYSILNEAVTAIMQSQSFEDNDLKLVVPDFEEKILFNSLSEKIKHFLICAGYQIGDLEDYFNVNSDYVRSELQTRFKEFYEESKAAISDLETDCNDKRFIYILRKAMAKESKPYRDAALVLMSYYFDSCDIFEEPVRVNAV